jgi:hypothetical protein
LPALVQLLGAGSETVQETAAAALCSIAETSVGLTAVNAAGGVSLLLQQLGSDNDPERQQAAAGVCKLSDTSAAGVQVLIGTPNSVATLMQALQGTSSAELRTELFAALGKMAACDHAAQAAADALQLPVLMSLLGAADETAQGAAAAALQSAAETSDGVAAVLEAGGIRQLLIAITPPGDSLDTFSMLVAARGICLLASSSSSEVLFVDMQASTHCWISRWGAGDFGHSWQLGLHAPRPRLHQSQGVTCRFKFRCTYYVSRAGSGADTQHASCHGRGGQFVRGCS